MRLIQKKLVSEVQSELFLTQEPRNHLLFVAAAASSLLTSRRVTFQNGEAILPPIPKPILM